MGKLYSINVLGLSEFKANIDSSHNFLTRIWSWDSGSNRDHSTISTTGSHKQNYGLTRSSPRRGNNRGEDSKCWGQMDALPEKNKHNNKWVKLRTLKVGDLVLGAASHIQKGMNASKFALKWQGPYIILEAYDSGYYFISPPNLKYYLTPINEKWLKLYLPWSGSSKKLKACITLLELSKETLSLFKMRQSKLNIQMLCIMCD